MLRHRCVSLQTVTTSKDSLAAILGAAWPAAQPSCSRPSSSSATESCLFQQPISSTSGRHDVDWGFSHCSYSTSALRDSSRPPTASETSSNSTPPLQTIAWPPQASQQRALRLFGRRLTGDPGSPRYTAPVVLPPPMRPSVLPVLLSDPWPQAHDAELRRQDAQKCVDWLRRCAPQGATAVQIFHGVNAEAATDSAAGDVAAVDRPKDGTADSTGAGTSSSVQLSTDRRQYVINRAGHGFGSTVYVTGLLEQLRRERFVMGRADPAEWHVNLASPKYPRVYVPLADQAAQYGHPRDVARRAHARRQGTLKRALCRLRQGKPPFPIFRRVANSSRFHYELALEQARQHMAAADSRSAV